MTSFCFPAHYSPYEKGSTLKGKNLLMRNFILKIDPFSEGRQNNFDRVASPESVFTLLKTCTSL